MDEEVAKIVVIALTAIGAVIWLTALAFTLRARRERQPADVGVALPFDIETGASPCTVVGSAEVAGQPAELAAKLTEQLARGGLMPIGPVKILKSELGEVVFEPAMTNAAGTAFSAPGFGRGRFRFSGHGPRTQIDYAVETTSPTVLTALSWVFLALGLAALVFVPWLQFAYVLPSPNPNIRAQSLQTAQMIHLLWPPFLFAFVARQPARILRAQVGALVHNLPYS
jgi:hypothetical protein